MKSVPPLRSFWFLICSALAAWSSIFAQSDELSDDPEPIAWAEPEFENISVHDPSVIRVEDAYYIFGSHLSAAKTTDWMAWERVADLVSESNPLFENVLEDLEATFDWAETNTLWAPDVIQLADGRYYFYYDACRGDSPLSAMGVAVSDTIEGPYEDLGIFLRSGMWGQLSEDGERVYDAVVHPNVVDPDVFYDEEGKLWMVYGSYSGGIFLMEMDEETGFPLEGQGYGQRLMGGNHQRIEGACILYSPHTEYYYLFVSFGGLAADGGYNIRVARSETVEGPYEDSMGQLMTEVRSSVAFNDVAIDPYGVKLMGNYLIDGEYPRIGYVSPGHNTAYYDDETGQYFLIFHTRFPFRGEIHEVRVHEMMFNEDGWPVVAPLRFAPRVEPEPEDPIEDEDAGDDSASDDEDDSSDAEDTGGEDNSGEGDSQNPDAEDPDEPEQPLPPVYLDTIEATEIAGVYEWINHGRATTAAIVESVDVFLMEDGTIIFNTELDSAEDSNEPEPEPEFVPTWAFDEGNLFTVDLGSEAGLFKGRASTQWNETLQAFVLTFSAVSAEGVSLWGIRIDDLPSE